MSRVQRRSSEGENDVNRREEREEKRRKKKKKKKPVSYSIDEPPTV